MPWAWWQTLLHVTRPPPAGESVHRPGAGHHLLRGRPREAGEEAWHASGVGRRGREGAGQGTAGCLAGTRGEEELGSSLRGARPEAWGGLAMANRPRDWEAPAPWHRGLCTIFFLPGMHSHTACALHLRPITCSGIQTTRPATPATSSPLVHERGRPVCNRRASPSPPH